MNNYSAAIAFSTLLVLLMIGGIEPHPGPGTKQNKQNLHQAKISNTDSPSSHPRTNDIGNIEEGNISDVMKMLREMTEKMNSMDSKMDMLNSKVNDQLESVMKENKEPKERIIQLEEKMDDLEGRSGRNNLLFHGIPQPDGHTETWNDCEEAVKSVIKDKMGVQDEVKIERAHRLRGGKAPHPIIVLFSSYKQKEAVFSERAKLKNQPNLFVSEDFTPRVREKRRQLLPFLKDAKKNGKKAHLKFDTLVVEGKTYSYDSDRNQLEERGRR